MKLRDYQKEAIKELFSWFAKNSDGNPLMILPTGAGKSVILAATVKVILESWPNQRIAMLVHSRELIEQNYLKLVELYPGVPAGIYSAGLNRKDSHAQVLYAGIQSIYKQGLHLGKFDLVFIDECHLVSDKGNTMYRKFIEDMSIINPALRVIGLTATKYRLDSGYLHQGEDALFSDVATEVTIKYLLEQGYLCKPTSKATRLLLDTKKIKHRGGEFIASDIERAFTEQGHLIKALNDAMTKAADRNSWLIFCPTVAIAEEVTEYLKSNNISCETVSGKTKSKDRDEIIQKYKRGEIRALSNCNVLTTGFDAPATDCLIILRPTESTGLHIQMIGRGMRLHESKKDCLVLDYVGNLEKHGCVDDPIINLPGKKGEPGEAPVKICDQCEVYLPASARVCDNCGYEFPVKERVYDHTHSTAAAVSSDIEPELVEVGRWKMKVHQKLGKPDSVRIDYCSAGILYFVVASEWVFPGHKGKARLKAIDFWIRHGGKTPYPGNAQEFIDRQDELLSPKFIEVLKSGKYKNVVGRKMEAA